MCHCVTHGPTYLMVMDDELFEVLDSVVIRNGNNLSFILNEWRIMNKTIRNIHKRILKVNNLSVFEKQMSTVIASFNCFVANEIKGNPMLIMNEVVFSYLCRLTKCENIAVC